MQPDWLPPQLVLAGSSISDDYAKLYEVFERDFISSAHAVVDGSRVIVNNVIDPSVDGGYTYGFTHLVTHGQGAGRSIDYERARKLPWVRAILDNCAQPEVTAFYVQYAKDERLYLWLTDYDFVVVLKKLKSRSERESPTKIIVTGYHVYSQGRRTLQRLYGRSSRQL
jgi:hypothetical protein